VRQRWLHKILATTAAIAAVASNLPAQADVVREDISAGQASQLPVYCWRERSGRPRGIILAIHGLAMHGTAYDAWGKRLAADGYMVVAPDLRGCGRWQQKDRCACIAYDATENDLAALAKTMRSRYKNVPLLLAGESLGGTLALRLAAKRPELVDGLILSAPALKHHHHWQWKTAADAILSLVDPRHRIDVTPYIRNYYSEDPHICTEEHDDPLMRTDLSIGELLSSYRVIASTPSRIDAIPADMPILIMQGQNDQMVKHVSIDLLCQRLRSKNTSVKVFPGRGHILLETAFLRSETLETVKTWLQDNCRLRQTDNAKVAQHVPHSLLPKHLTQPRELN
jgi:acylglycerol lipase